MRRLHWAIVLLMDTPFVFYHGRRKLHVGWLTIVRYWWATTRAMWRRGE